MSEATEIIAYAIFMIALLAGVSYYSYRIGQLRERHKDG